MRTYYEVLGITPQAPCEIVPAVYRAWMKTMNGHPDLGGDEELAKDLNSAYDTLKDPEKRAKYDADIARYIDEPKIEASRRYLRTSIDAAIAYRTNDDEGWRDGRAIEVSMSGMRFKMEKFIEVGTHLTIAFPDSPASAIEAEVRWLRDDREGYLAGVEFYQTMPDILKRLQVR